MINYITITNNEIQFGLIDLLIVV